MPRMVTISSPPSRLAVRARLSGDLPLGYSAAGRVVAIEVDHALVAALRSRFDESRLQVVDGDTGFAKSPQGIQDMGEEELAAENFEIKDIPEDMVAKAQEYREMMIETAVECSRE